MQQKMGAATKIIFLKDCSDIMFTKTEQDKLSVMNWYIQAMMDKYKPWLVRIAPRMFKDSTTGAKHHTRHGHYTIIGRAKR